ncbi:MULTISPECIES: DUF5518 domain-containing protein [Methanococcoides]|uniref:DUF5518 domain-containing protein n=1 Tax=Methanococcoides seepicolus TaxID=2828780 RepID=A0A9E4ZDC4_9EURY|nr:MULTISPECIES: DUF5518 domain-containing protein [Methanococcoides]MCM1986085.1 DUF5518 domain-containing protein [Methanococcoides seepicolus]NOQ48888.1 hypothetical protein [Methanococcoides sp.]
MNIIKGAIIGSICTLVLYMVPVLNALSPFFGCAIGGYVAKEGGIGGVKVGLLMTLLFAVPGFLISGVFVALMSEIPVIGAILAGSGIVITIAIMIYTAIFGIIGGVVGGAVADDR